MNLEGAYTHEYIVTFHLIKLIQNHDLSTSTIKMKINPYDMINKDLEVNIIKYL